MIRVSVWFAEGKAVGFVLHRPVHPGLQEVVLREGDKVEFKVDGLEVLDEVLPLEGVDRLSLIFPHTIEMGDYERMLEISKKRGGVKFLMIC